jgi:hypothetical protein
MFRELIHERNELLSFVTKSELMEIIKDYKKLLKKGMEE